MLALGFLGFVFISLIVASIWWYATKPSNLPPGPRGLPFVGSMFETWRGSRTLHKKLHSWTKIYGGLYQFYVAEKLVLVLGDWNVIQEALVKQGDAFAGRPVPCFPGHRERRMLGLSDSFGELWKVQRRFVLSTLRDLGLGRSILEMGITDEVDRLIEAIDAEDGRAFNPAPFLPEAAANVIGRLAFGHRFEHDDADFRSILQMFDKGLDYDVSFLSPFLISSRVAALCSKSPLMKELSERNSRILTFAEREMEKCLENFDPMCYQPSNYVQAFRKAQTDGENNWTFTDKQLIASIRSLFVDGTTTTSTTLLWSIFYLAHNPTLQDKINEEIRQVFEHPSVITYADRSKLPLTEATILETQRLANLLPLGGLHRTVVNCKLQGYDIPADTIVVPLLTAALRDPNVYPNPEEFDPSRFLDTSGNGKGGLQRDYLIPFSAGKRMCLGEPVAKMELFLFFSRLVSTFKFSFSETEPWPAFDAERVMFARSPVPFKIHAARREE